MDWEVWKAQRYKPDDLHVHPVNDSAEHVLTRRCWCQPEFRLQDGQRVSEWYRGQVIVTHNAKDGRELIKRHGIQ